MEKLSMQALGRLFLSRERYERAQKAARVGQLPFVRGGAIKRLPGPLGGWTAVRDMKALPSQSFRDWWREDRGES